MRFSFGVRSSHSGHQFALFVKSLYSLISNDFKTALTGPAAGGLIPSRAICFSWHIARLNQTLHTVRNKPITGQGLRRCGARGKDAGGGSGIHRYAYLVDLTLANPAVSLMTWTHRETNTNCARSFVEGAGGPWSVRTSLKDGLGQR